MTRSCRFLSILVRRRALPDATPAALIQLRRGPTLEYWIALPNFYAIQTYNPRVFYAMAVTQLANALAEAQASERAAKTAENTAR